LKHQRVTLSSKNSERWAIRKKKKDNMGWMMRETLSRLAGSRTGSRKMGKSCYMEKTSLEDKIMILYRRPPVIKERQNCTQCVVFTGVG
jgi:hypothetical protein